MPLPKAKILIADDHRIVIDGLQRLLEPEYDVVGAVNDGRALLSAVSQLNPDVALVDVSMPLLNGIYATRRIVKRHPRVRVIIFTMNADVDIAREALVAGAKGYVLKGSPIEEILSAVGEVLKGNVYLSQPVTRDILCSCRTRGTNGYDLESPLSAREKEVLLLSAEGCSHKEVASALKISVKTAQSHRQNIKKKLGLESVAQLTQYAVKRRIVDPVNAGMTLHRL